MTDRIIERIGQFVIAHGERDDSQMCLCGHEFYGTCPNWATDDSKDWVGGITLHPDDWQEA